MNPYYDADKLGLEMVTFSEPDLCYEFNDLCFWKKEGVVYSGSSSGCSCPTPFEEYEGESLKEILPLLERVPTLKKAKETIKSWSRESSNRKSFYDHNWSTEIEQWWPK